MKLSPREENAVKAILRNSKLTAKQLGESLDVTKRQAERITTSLKSKIGVGRHPQLCDITNFFQFLRDYQIRRSLVFCHMMSFMP